MVEFPDFRNKYFRTWQQVRYQMKGKWEVEQESRGHSLWSTGCAGCEIHPGMYSTRSYLFASSRVQDPSSRIFQIDSGCTTSHQTQRVCTLLDYLSAIVLFCSVAYHTVLAMYSNLFSRLNSIISWDGREETDMYSIVQQIRREQRPHFWRGGVPVRVGLCPHHIPPLQ